MQVGSDSAIQVDSMFGRKLGRRRAGGPECNSSELLCVILARTTTQRASSFDDKRRIGLPRAPLSQPRALAHGTSWPGRRLGHGRETRKVDAGRASGPSGPSGRGGAEAGRHLSDVDLPPPSASPSAPTSEPAMGGQRRAPEQHAGGARQMGARVPHAGAPARPRPGGSSSRKREAIRSSGRLEASQDPPDKAKTTSPDPDVREVPVDIPPRPAEAHAARPNPWTRHE
ncbi:hypothetical protein JHW43_001871 [Diplocarpon mali]|nr:hypothetical protein JHW43_001871 [Diplocarpon mali]